MTHLVARLTLLKMMPSWDAWPSYWSWKGFAECYLLARRTTT
jgi:hypothetical protein